MKNAHRPLTRICIVPILAFLFMGCAASMVKQKYEKLHRQAIVQHNANIAGMESRLRGRMVDLDAISLYKAHDVNVEGCGMDADCVGSAHQGFIEALIDTYSQVDFAGLFLRCHNACKTAQQLEYLAALIHNRNVEVEIDRQASEAEKRQKSKIADLETEYRREYLLAKEKDAMAMQAFAAGMLAYSQAMQQNAYQQPVVYPNSSNLIYLPPSNQAYSQNIHSTAQSYGPFTYYSGDIHGSTQKIGPFTYYNLEPGLHGSSQQMGNFTYYNFNSGLSGTTQQIGNVLYHNFNTGVTGTTQSIGDFDYTDFSDGTRCTTQTIGNMEYTNCE